MNYTQLTAAIKGFAENDFPATVGSFTSADQLARFVELAEQRVYNTVQLPAFRKNVTGNTTTANKYLATQSTGTKNVSPRMMACRTQYRKCSSACMKTT